jgi:hypothetical protein
MVPREVVALWAQTGRAVSYARVRRLREAGLVEVWPGIGEIGRLVLCTRRGLRVIHRNELSTPTFSPANLHHTAVAARIAAQLEVSGAVSSPSARSSPPSGSRESASTRIELRRGRKHRPDLILLGHPNEAIEVELTNKGTSRLDGLVRAWRRSLNEKELGCVRYLCSPRALPCVERAVRRTIAEEFVGVEPLVMRDGSLGLGAASPALQGDELSRQGAERLARQAERSRESRFGFGVERPSYG